MRISDWSSDVCSSDLFRKARSHNGWMDRQVSTETLRTLYDLTKWGPTAANSTPARFAFLRTAAAKERLKPLLSPGNIDKVAQAPCRSEERRVGKGCVSTC